MADKLGFLAVLLLFSSFRPVISEGVSNQEEKSFKQPQFHEGVEEEQMANRNSENDEAPSSETAESKGSPGLFSQMFSELAAPLYGEDEQDFLSEDSEHQNPSDEDQTGDDYPKDANYETSSGKGNKPDFASPELLTSVSENVNSAQTAEKETYFGGASEIDADEEKGKDQQLPNANKEAKSVDQTQFHEGVEEEQTADRNSKEDSEDKVPSSETAESMGSPGFFSQVFSELAAPLYGEDEQDFLSEDSELQNPSDEDQTRDDEPEDENYETSSGKGNKPDFASPELLTSVSENVNSAGTAEKETYFGGASESDADEEKGKDQQLPNANKEGNVSESLPHSYTSDSANAESKNPELSDEQTGEPDVDLAANTKSESSGEQTDDIEIDSQQENEQLNSYKMQFEPDLTVKSVNAEDSKTEPLVKEETAEKEAEIDTVGVNRGSQDPEQEEPRSADSLTGMQFDKKQLHYEDGATELSDEDLEHLRVKSKPSQEQVPSDTLEEEEQDLRKNRKGEVEELEAKERTEEQAKEFRLENEKKDIEEQKKEQEEQARNPRLEKEKKDIEEQKNVQEEQARNPRLENEKKDIEEQKKVQEEQARNLRLEKEKKDIEEQKNVQEEQARNPRLEKEKKDKEEQKNVQEEQARNLGLEKKKMDTEEQKKVQEEQARNLGLENKKTDTEEQKKVQEEQARNLRLKKEKRDAEEKKVQEEQTRNLRLKKVKREAEEKKKAAEEKKKAVEEQTRKFMLEKEKQIAEEKKKAIKEQARKVRLEKEKKAAEEEKQRKEEKARQLRLESLKKQRQQIEETERMEMERLHREEEKEISLKKLSGAERTEEKVNDKVHVPQDEGTDQGKENLTQEKGATSEDGEDDEHMKVKGAFDRKLAEEEAALKKRLEMLNEERRNFEKMAIEYQVSKKDRQQKEQNEKRSTKHSAESEPSKAATLILPSPKQVKTSHDQAATQPLNTSVTTTTVPAVNEELTAKGANTKTEATLVKSLQGISTKAKEPIGSRTKRTTATVTAATAPIVKEEGLSSADVKLSEATDLGMEKEHVDKSREDKIPSDKVTCIEGFCQAKPNVISLASRFQKVEDSLTSKVVLGENQFSKLKENNDSKVNKTLSGYATFMRAFRNFHEKSVLFAFSYWPVAKNTTRGLLAYVGLDGMFDQLCDDLADVHPAVLFATFLFGTLGFLYFFWSLTFGRMRHGAQGPNPRDVLRSYEARIRILEEEVKSLEADKLKADMERNAACKEKMILDEQLKSTHEVVKNLTKEVDNLKKQKQDVEVLVKQMKDNCQKLITESKEKSEEITGCENMILDLRAKIEAKDRDIQKLNDDFQKQQMEREADKKHIDELDEKIQQADIEKTKLEHLLTETKEKKQNLQVEFDDQLLRLTELQQQYEFRCNEVEVLKDCLKQINLQGDGEEEPDEDEMAGRLQNLMNVDEIKTENTKLQEKVTELATEAEELRRIRKMLENDNVEKTERLDQAESKASQAMLSQREKEIELEALQKYFKSTEVELHRKITAEESSRISIENQLQSEQAKASTAVVDADKYKQLYLDIKKQIEEIDESKKEQLSNMEKKAHQNWLDYRATLRELDGLKDENEILRRKLYDLEMRGSRPSSSASSQLNHVDGRDSPSRRSPMSGLPGHGSPVPFMPPPMMGPPPPPPLSSMFPGQRRPHPAEVLGMTPPRPPFPSPGPASRGHSTPPPITKVGTPQSSNGGDRPDSFVPDSKDGVPPPPPPPTMSGYGHPPLPPMMRMPMFPPRPMVPPPPSGPLPRMFFPRPGEPMPPPPPLGPRPQASSTPNRS